MSSVCTWESSLISITLKVSLWRAAAVTGVQCVYLGIQPDFNNIKSQSVRAAAVAGVQCVYLGIQPDYNNIKSQSVEGCSSDWCPVCVPGNPV